jgi:hypothetical protein
MTQEEAKIATTNRKKQNGKQAQRLQGRKTSTKIARTQEEAKIATTNRKNQNDKQAQRSQ